MKFLLSLEVMCRYFSPILGMIALAWLLENRRLFKIIKYLEKRVF